MSNSEKYRKAFIETFDVNEKDLNSEFTFQNIENWDSIAHMSLITALEDAFNIMLDTDDILNFGSFEAGKKRLAKYGIEF